MGRMTLTGRGRCGHWYGYADASGERNVAAVT